MPIALVVIAAATAALSAFCYAIQRRPPSGESMKQLSLHLVIAADIWAPRFAILAATSVSGVLLLLALPWPESVSNVSFDFDAIKKAPEYGIVLGAFLACVFGLLADMGKAKREKKQDRRYHATALLYDFRTALIKLSGVRDRVREGNVGDSLEPVYYDEDWRVHYSHCSPALPYDFYGVINYVYQELALYNDAIESGKQQSAILHLEQVFKQEHQDKFGYNALPKNNEIIAALASIAGGHRFHRPAIRHLVKELLYINELKKFQPRIISTAREILSQPVGQRPNDEELLMGQLQHALRRVAPKGLRPNLKRAIIETLFSYGIITVTAQAEEAAGKAKP